MAEQGQERTEQATPRRRQEARRKGTVAKSTDLTTALVMFTLAILLPLLAGGLATGLIQGMKAGLQPAGSFSLANVMQHFTSVIRPAVAGLLPICCIGVAVGVASNFMQVGFVLSGESMNPQFNRINPVEG